MANSIAKLAILLTTDASGVGKGFAQAGRDVNGFASSLQTLSKRFLLMEAGIKAFQVAKWGVQLAAQAETAKVSFDVMLGSAAKSREMLEGLREFALQSPFDMAGLQESAQLLLQFGVEVEKIIPTLRMLGDVSLGDAQRLHHLSLAFAQMSAAGRLTGQDLLQMINAGFNPLQEISRQTGESLVDLKKRMEEGAISSAEVAAAFKSATAEGGRFNGMMEKMTGTLSGQWAKFKENIAEGARGFGGLLAPSITQILSATNEVIDQMKGVQRATSAGGTDVVIKFIDKEQVNNIKEAAEWAKKLKETTDTLNRKGASLAESLRTPAEVYGDSVREFNKMLEFGSINAETWSRAMKKAREDLNAQEKSASRIRELQREASTGAASRFTSSGQSAAFQAALELKRLEAVNREEVAATRDGNRIAQLQLEEMRKEKPQVVIRPVENL